MEEEDVAPSVGVDAAEMADLEAPAEVEQGVGGGGPEVDVVAVAQQPEAAAAAALPSPPAAQQQQQGNKVQVKYLVLPEGFSHITTYDISIPAVYMYAQLERDLRVDRTHLHISWEGRPFQETDTLNEVATIPESGPLILHLRFDTLPKHLKILNVGEITPGIIFFHLIWSIFSPTSGIRTVTMHYGEGIPPKVCTVTLVVAYDRKPFLGGFKHKKNGSLYYHAVVQTDPLEREVKVRTDKVSRDTQTRGQTRTSQTARESATQMARTGLCIDTGGDVVYTSKPYFSANRLHELRIRKSVVIQSHIRGWFARKHARSLRKDKSEATVRLAEEDDVRRALHEEKRTREIERRTHPRTPRDFCTLYNELEAWRLNETRRIKGGDMSKEERQLALQELLKKETKLLQTIHRLQNAASKENKEARVKQLLHGMTSLKRWGKVCKYPVWQQRDLCISATAQSQREKGINWDTVPYFL